MSKTNAELKEENESLKLALSISKSREKTTKDENSISKYHCKSDDTRTEIKYKSLNEYKRYSEDKQSEMLKEFCEKLNLEKLKSCDFHKCLFEMRQELLELRAK